MAPPKSSLPGGEAALPSRPNFSRAGMRLALFQEIPMARSDRGSSLSAPGRPTTDRGGNPRPSPVKTSESGVDF
ncbi:MAG: hypothetical protein AAGK78_06700, partial [Planctomycetota bacterium]